MHGSVADARSAVPTAERHSEWQRLRDELFYYLGRLRDAADLEAADRHLGNHTGDAIADGLRLGYDEAIAMLREAYTFEEIFLAGRRLKRRLLQAQAEIDRSERQMADRYLGYGGRPPLADRDGDEYAASHEGWYASEHETDGGARMRGATRDRRAGQSARQQGMKQALHRVLTTLQELYTI